MGMLGSAITHGISHLVGSVTPGNLADLVLWRFENFGAKPEMVLKSGVIVWAQVRTGLEKERVLRLMRSNFVNRWEMRMLQFRLFSRRMVDQCGVPTQHLRRSTRYHSSRKFPLTQVRRTRTAHPPIVYLPIWSYRRHGIVQPIQTRRSGQALSRLEKTRYEVEWRDAEDGGRC